MTQRRIYQDEYPYFVTFRTKESTPLFEKTEFAVLLSKIIFNAGKLKRFDVLSYQIMPDHVHLLTHASTDSVFNPADRVDFDRTRMDPVRTLERVLSGDFIETERTFSNVRSVVSSPLVRSQKNIHTISNLLQSIKGNFSRKIHQGNIWQKRFYTRIINNQRYLTTIIEYIKQNPVKENLPEIYNKIPYQFFNQKQLNNLF